MSRDHSRMPAPVTAAVVASSTARFSKQNELLSPTSAAVVFAAEQRAAKPGHVTTGSLRVIVIQVADLPTNGSTSAPPPPSPSPSSSWLRRRHGHGHKAKAAAAAASSSGCGAFDSVCVLLKIGASSRTLATSAARRGDSVCWNEEFLFDNVTTSDELRLVCIDRAKNEPYFTIPLRCDDSITSSPGFIGKVSVPLVRLPEGEDIEQWYSLVPKEAYLSLRTALRVSICFTPVGGRARSARAESSVMVRQRPPPLTMTQGQEPGGNGPMHLPPSPLGTTPQPVAMSTGVIDYAIVVGPQDADYSGENTMLFRYPAADRPGFPLPTKVEWFCFPGGPEIVEQVHRPASKVFSFILVGGQDGLSRCYAVCVMVYHRSHQGPTNVWQATCIAFLTRIPLLDPLTACLLSFTHTWIASSTSKSTDRRFEAEHLLVDLCHGVLTPVRGVLGVEFALPDMGRLRMVLQAETTIYHMHSHEMRVPSSNRITMIRRNNNASHQSSRKAPSSPSKASPHMTMSEVCVRFQPLVYSLSPLFQHFDVKSLLEITALMLCEYRILIHSTQMSVLSPIAEGLCALIYPFRWQHPYVPILPSVLCEYLQAPLPYVLGVNSSWLPELLENGRPDHLVIVDIDRGSVQRHDSGPVLPPRLSRALRKRVHQILYPDDGEEICPNTGRVPWSERIERLVRGEFVCFLATMLKGYRDCLFFVNQDLPVFNKRRFFASHAVDNEATPFLTRLFRTQAFQAFLENHDAAELNVFHAVHVALLRGSEVIAWPHSCPPCLEGFESSSRTGSMKRLSWRAHEPVTTPVYRMNSDLNGVVNDEASDEDESRLQHKLAVQLERALDKSKDASELLCMRGGGGLNVEAMDARFAELMNRTMDYHTVADGLGIDARILEDHSEWLKRPHEANQGSGVHMNGHVPASLTAASLASTGRALSKDEERMEQLVHKCLTSIFTSDDQLSIEEAQQCEARFKSQYARDLFVLILMQPSQQYVDNLDSAVASSWYNPKGSGSCIGESGFQLLSRMAIELMDQCAIHEDFTNARGMLQVAAQYYHFVEDKHSGIGFAKKEYLVHSLRARPICRSLDMWQHAFSKELDAVLLAAGDSIRGGNSCFASLEDGESTSSVSDEMFFSVIGSLIYDMLSVDVPVGNVQTFVTVMCSTYQKDRELRDTLKQLVENVCRAVEMSNDSAPQPTPVPRPAASTTVDGSGAVTVTCHEVSPATANTARPQYDLDTVIRRKMSVQDGPLPLTSRRPPAAPISSRANGRDGDKRGGPAELVLSPTAVAAQRWRGASNAAQPVTTAVLLGRQSSPVLSLSVHHGHVACGVADPLIALMDAVPMSLNGSSSITKLEGHTNAVVAVQLQGQTLISGSRDHTLRAWDLRASPKKRGHLFGFLSSSTPPPAHRQTHDIMPASASSSGHSHSGEQIDGAHVSRKSIVMKGHTGAITCLEIGRQLSTDRAIVASGSMDATIRLWDTSKEHSVAVLGSSGGGTRPGVSCLRYLAHFDILVSGSRDESALKSWDMATSKIRCSVPAHRGSIRDIQITGERLVTAANDRVAKVWDARFRDGASFSHALRGHGGPVLCLSLGGPADPNICTGSADGIVRVWDLRYVQKGPRLALAGHQGPVTCLQRDFTRLVSGSEDGSLRVWDMHSGVCLKEARAHQSGVTCMALQDASVYSGSWDGSVRVWDIEVTGR